MNDIYKVMEIQLDLGNTALILQETINMQYSEGYEFVQIIPHNGYYLMVFKKRDPYKQITDTCPAQMYPKTHFFKNGKEMSEEAGKDITLRDILKFFDDIIKKGTPVRVYSMQNQSVVGSVIDGKELIPENIYNYKYLDARIEPNIRMKKAPDILVIIVE